MKKNISKYLAYSLTAIAALTLGSCGDDDHFDVTGNPNNLAYFRAGDANSNEFTATVKHTPVGDFSNLSIKLPLYVQRSVAEGTKVTVAIDTTVVAQYNEAKETSYAALPPAAAELVKNYVVFEADTLASTDSVEVQLLESALASLDKEEYLMPLRITSVSGGAVGSEERGIIYVKINNVTDYIHVNDNDEVTGTIAHTPVGSFGGIKLDLPAKVSNAAKVGAQATISIDNSLVAEYNAEHNTAYVELPAGALTIENATVSIAEGATASATNFKASIPESKLASLKKAGYLVPLKISASRTDGVEVANAGVIYLVITTAEKLVNEGARLSDLVGSEISTTEMASWTCETENIADVTNTGDWSGWNNGTYVVDLQAVKNVTGMRFSAMYAQWGYRMKDASISLSEDGSSWTDCGTISSFVLENNWVTYALYGAIPARYIKMTLNADYGIDAIRVFAQ